MFSRAKSKLEDSRTIFKKLQATEDLQTFRALFNSFLQSSRAVTLALQKDGKHIHGFTEWYKIKQDEMHDDELLSFMNIARTEDFHEGKHRLNFSTYIQRLDTSNMGNPPSPKAHWTINNEGLFWINNKGKPQEERIPIKQGGIWMQHVSITNPPTFHLGQKLEKNAPIELCQLTLTYFENLVFEVDQKFST